MESDNEKKTEINITSIIDSHIGILNIKNNCFINAVLQILIHNAYFINKFLNNKIKDKDNSISYKLYQIILQMNDKNNLKKFIDISNFLYFFGMKHNYIQNDGEEFMLLLLEELNNELNDIIIKPNYNEFNYLDNKSKIVLNKEFNEFILNYEKSIIVELFYIQLITKYSCKCGNIIYRFQKLIDLPLIFPANNNIFSLIELFEFNFKQEIVDFHIKCIKCNNINKNLKEVKISIIPEILIISLQRFDKIKNTKNMSTISIPFRLNIIKYIDTDIII